MYTRIGLVFFLMALLAPLAQAQPGKAYVARANQLAGALAKPLAASKQDSLKQALDAHLKSYLKQAPSLTATFDSLPQISKLVAPDEKLSLVTYPMRNADESYRYGGFVQYIAPNGKLKLVALKDNSDYQNDPERSIHSPRNWYGALYYEIIMAGKRHADHYILLGWDGHDILTDRKVIEPIKMDGLGGVQFGAPVLQTQQGMRYRRIFKFADEAVVSLHYDEKEELILYDHLSAPASIYKGSYAYYGPDFTIDALEYTGGIWKLHINYEARNPRRR